METPSTNRRIGFRELTTTTFFLVAIRGTDENTTLYFQIGGNAAWMVPLLQWLAFVSLFVPLTRKMERHGADDVFRLLKLMWGPTATRLVASGLFLLLLALGALCFRPYVVMLTVMFYLRTPEHAVGLVLLLGGMYVASRGYEAIGRMGSMFFVYAMLFFVLLILGIADLVDPSYTFPLFGPGIPQILRESFLTLGFFGEPFFLAFLAGATKGGVPTFRRAILTGTGIAASMMSTFFLMYLWVFGFPSVNDILFHYQQLTRFAHFGLYISHIEAIFLYIWVMASVARLAVVLYLLVQLLRLALDVPEGRPLLPLVTAYLFLTSLIPVGINDIFRWKYAVVVSATFAMLLLGFAVVLWPLPAGKRPPLGGRLH
ncbi:MAG: spore germination protein [Brockia lithotrophica]|uniref:Spore germination protein n=1 Tax=Brockia lithotrophica TaxID=933949 RepID=A0A2T5G8J1_9BACL|nr:GerAB/ArcD/ProY family transporter [Brockia lithotrophica]PTQ52479.1 MAG: spore germination protein [Brockia lithotrophica]